MGVTGNFVCFLKRYLANKLYVCFIYIYTIGINMTNDYLSLEMNKDGHKWITVPLTSILLVQKVSVICVLSSLIVHRVNDKVLLVFKLPIHSIFYPSKMNFSFQIHWRVDQCLHKA